MTIPRVTGFDFRFDGGRGIRTDQLNGAYVESVETITGGYRVNFVATTGAKSTLDLPKGLTQPEIDARVKAVAHLIAPPVAMRIAWSQSNVFSESRFFPVQGAAVGNTSGLVIKRGGGLLQAILELYFGVWVEGDPSIEEINVHRGSVFAYLIDSNVIQLSDKAALTVNSVDGHYYRSHARLRQYDYENFTLNMVLTGKDFIRTGDVEGFALTGDPSLLPKAKLPEIRFVDSSDTPATIKPYEYAVGNSQGNALEFIQHSAAPAGILRVSTIPTVQSDALIYLSHDEHFQSGVRKDRLLTPGLSPNKRFFGYSDGSVAPATGTLSGITSPLSEIGSGAGSYSGSDVISTWELHKIVSHEHDWLSSLAKVSLTNVDYTLQGLVHQGGVWVAFLAIPQAYANGNAIALNFKRADDSVVWQADTTLTHVAGLYWWNETAYELLETDGLVPRGAHVAASTYIANNIVTDAGSVYMALVNIAANTVLTDRTKWAVLFDPEAPSIDVGTALPAVADLPIGRLAAIGEVADVGKPAITGLAGPPHYRHATDRSLSFFRVDYLGAGRIGYCIASQGDDLYGGLALSAGGSIDPPISGLNTVMQEPLPLGKVRIVVESTTAGTLGNQADPSGIILTQASTDLALALINTRLTPKSGQASGIKRWEKVLDAPLLKVNTVYYLGFLTPSQSAIQLHTGDYLTPLIDQTAIDIKSSDLAERALAAARQVGRVRSVPSSPDFREDNYRNIEIDHSAARVWIGERRPDAVTPATAVATLWAITSPFLGARSFEPTYIESNDNDIFYDTTRSQWRKRTRSYGTIGIWAAEGFRQTLSAYSGEYFWLGERTDANEAAAHLVTPIVTDANYLFYSKTNDRIEKFTNANFTPGRTTSYLYEPHYLVTQVDLTAALAAQFAPEIITDFILPAGGVRQGFDINVGAAEQIKQTIWDDDQRQPFTRLLTLDDDQKLMSIELRWKEENSTGTDQSTEKLDRAVGITIQAGMFRHFPNREDMNYESETIATGLNKTFYKSSAAGSADIFIRRPDWAVHNTDTWGEAKWAFGRYRKSGIEGIAIVLGRGTDYNDTNIKNIRCKIMLHGK